MLLSALEDGVFLEKLFNFIFGAGKLLLSALEDGVFLGLVLGDDEFL
jgi:hypothetical protein